MGAKRKSSTKRSARKETRNGNPKPNGEKKSKFLWLAAAGGALIMTAMGAYFFSRHHFSTSSNNNNTEQAKEYNIKGIALIQQNLLEKSLGYFDECSALDPSFVHCYNSKAGALRMLGRKEEAIQVLHKGEKHVIARFGFTHADLAILYQSLFLVLKDLGHTGEAVAYIQKAIAREPSASLYYNWATLSELDHKTKVDLYSKALQLEPNYFPAFCSRAHSYTFLGEWEALERDYPQVLEYQQALIDGEHQQRTDSRTCLLPYHTTYMNISASMMRDTALQFAQREGTLGKESVLPTLLPFDISPVLDKNSYMLRKLRVGYVSSDFNVHPVGRNMLGVFMAHDKRKFEIFAFATQHRPNDQVTNAIYPHVAEYVDISGIQEYAMAAQKIRGEYKIDVLVDLNGWTAGNRLKLFAARPAPVQIAHGLGFVGTIGATQALDYFVSDVVSSPRRFDKYYTEKIVRLPQSYLPASHKLVHITTEADKYNPATANKTQLRMDNGLPSDKDTFVYCSFQRLHRISKESFETWMHILQQTAPNSSILWMTGVPEELQDQLMERASNVGIENATSRILFSGGVNPGENLIRAQACDLHLDNWPYTAHSTGMDVLWAGVPLLAYLADYHDETNENQVPKMASRVSAGLLHTLGMPQLVMPSIEAFQAEAIRLATDQAAYTKLRNELVEKRISSPLFDLVSYARVHETAYLRLFQYFYEGKPPESIDVPPFNKTKPIKTEQTRESASSEEL